MVEEVWICAFFAGYCVCEGEDGVGEHEEDSGQVSGVGSFEEVEGKEEDFEACVCKF